jgi:hypothetical protein
MGFGFEVDHEQTSLKGVGGFINGTYERPLKCEIVPKM